MRILLTLALAASPTLALACPSAADLEGGILFRDEAGETETFTRFSEHVIESRFQASDGYENRVLLAQGIYLLELADIEEGEFVQGTRTTYSFPATPDALPAPLPGSVYAAEVGVFSSEGLRTDAQTYTFGPLTRATYGACSYDLITVTVTYADEQETVDTVHYLPELGVSYLAGSDYGLGEDRFSDRYNYFEIEAVAPTAPAAPAAPADGSGKKGGSGKK